MRAKLICEHSPIACWVSNFSNNHPGAKLYAYPISGRFTFPTIYFVVVAVVIPKDKVPLYSKKFEKELDDFAKGWSLGVHLDKISERKQKNGDLHLYYFFKAEALEQHSTAREKIKAYSLLHALFDQDFPPKRLRWILAENGLEYVFPVFDDVSSWKGNVALLKDIKLDSKPVYDIKFPALDTDYSSDYSAELAAQPDPLGELFSNNLQDLPFSLPDLDNVDPTMIRSLIEVQTSPRLWKRLRLRPKKEHIKFVIELLKEFLKPSTA